MTSTDIQMQVTHPAIRESLPDLRDIIYSEKLYFLMECHDPLSAAIAIQAGFKGLWASGLSISTSLGFRDANEASWTQVVDVVDRIADLTGAPILESVHRSGQLFCRRRRPPGSRTLHWHRENQGWWILKVPMPTSLSIQPESQWLLREDRGIPLKSTASPSR